MLTVKVKIPIHSLWHFNKDVWEVIGFWTDDRRRVLGPTINAILAANLTIVRLRNDQGRILEMSARTLYARGTMIGQVKYGPRRWFGLLPGRRTVVLTGENS